MRPLNVTIWNYSFLYFVIAVGVSIMIATSGFVQDDTWRHLAIGRLIVQSGGLPAIEPFGYDTISKQFIDFSWLTCVAFYIVYLVFDELGLIILAGVLAGLTFWIASAPARQDKDEQRMLLVSFVVILPLVLLTMKWRITARPEMFSYVGLAVLTVIRAPSSFTGACIGISTLLVWTNFHATAFFGLAVFSLRVIADLKGSIREQCFKACVILGGAAIAVLTNPWGYKLVLLALKQPFEPLNQRIFEFFPLIFDDLKSLLGPVLAFFVLSASTSLIRVIRNHGLNRVVLARIALFIFIAYSSFRYLRGIPFFLIVYYSDAMRLLTAAFNRIGRLKELRAQIIACGLVAWVFGAWSFAWEENYAFSYRWSNEMKAVDFLSASPVKGRILNDFAYGGYLMWKGADRYKLFIDNRSPLYLTTTFPEYFDLSDPQRCDAIIAKHDFEAMVMPLPLMCGVPGRPQLKCGMASSCYDRKKFAVVFWTQSVAVMIRRKPEYSEFIKAHEFKWVNPTALFENEIVASFKSVLEIPGGRKGLQDEIRRNLRIHPQDPKVLAYAKIYEALALQLRPEGI